MLEYSNTLSVSEYDELRCAVKWQGLVEEQVQQLIDNSDFIISCRDGEKIVGCARVFWDKGSVAYLADVMVKPEYQNEGIGTKLVKECIAYIENQLKTGWCVSIVILSAKGKESFYEKFGFQERPNINLGAGMQLRVVNPQA